MIPATFDYVAPESLDEALSALSNGGEDAKALAGGHSLVPLMKLRLAAPSLLVDLRRIPDLTGVKNSDGRLSIGAMTTHNAIATGSLGLPSKVAARIADQQVRNRGTIGGTLAHGDPASDLPAVLLALDGSVIVRGPSGVREIAAPDVFEDYLTTTVAPDELITEVRLPAPDGWGAGYAKFNRRVEDWAIVAVCAAVRKRADGSCEDVRVGLVNMGNKPLRASAVEGSLRGGALDAAALAAAAENAAEGTDPPADLNASAEYKSHLARVLCRRALAEAVAAT